MGGGDADNEFSDFLEFLADDDPREDIESTAATNENDGGREKDDESSSSEGYDDFLTYLNKFQKACDANSPVYVDKNEGVHGGGGDGQISSEDEELDHIGLVEVTEGMLQDWANESSEELDHIGVVEVTEDIMQHWANESVEVPSSYPKPPKWRFASAAKKSLGYSSADAGTVIEGG